MSYLSSKRYNSFDCVANTPQHEKLLPLDCSVSKQYAKIIHLCPTCANSRELQFQSIYVQKSVGSILNTTQTETLKSKH